MKCIYQMPVVVGDKTGVVPVEITIIERWVQAAFGYPSVSLTSVLPVTIEPEEGTSGIPVPYGCSLHQAQDEGGTDVPMEGQPHSFPLCVEGRRSRAKRCLTGCLGWLFERRDGRPKGSGARTAGSRTDGVDTDKGMEVGGLVEARGDEPAEE